MPCFAAVASSFIHSVHSNRPLIHPAGVRYVSTTAQVTNSLTDAPQRGDRELRYASENLYCMLYTRKCFLQENGFHNTDSLVVLLMFSY